MTHLDFVEKFNNKQIEVMIHKDRAGLVYRKDCFLPRRFIIRQAILRSIATGLTVMGLILLFFIPWQIAFTILIIGLLFFPISQKSATHGLLEAALLHKYIYEYLVEKQVLIFR